MSEELRKTVAEHSKRLQGHTKQLNAHSARLVHLEHEVQHHREAMEELRAQFTRQVQVIAELQALLSEMLAEQRQGRTEQLAKMNELLNLVQPTVVVP